MLGDSGSSALFCLLLLLLQENGRHCLDKNQVRVAFLVPHLVWVDIRRSCLWYFWAVLRVLASHCASTDTILAWRCRIWSLQLLPRLLLTQWWPLYQWVVVKVLTLLLSFSDTTLWGRDVSFPSCRVVVQGPNMVCTVTVNGGFITPTRHESPSWLPIQPSLAHPEQVSMGTGASYCSLSSVKVQVTLLVFTDPGGVGGQHCILWCLAGVECLFSASFPSY